MDDHAQRERELELAKLGRNGHFRVGRSLRATGREQGLRRRIAASVEDLELLTSLRCCELDAGGRRICEALLEALG